MLRKILIVDDNKINRQLLRKMLSGEYKTFEAENGQEAMEVMERIHDTISAVLLDLSMPVMDGYEVLSKMRMDSKLANIPVIVTTGNTEDGAEVKALSLGANDFIVKPYNPAVIKHRLWNTIHLRETAAYVNAMQRDRLTGLYNRETFFAKAEELIAWHEPGYYVMACFDIANFKVINDQYGTAKGDEVLKYVAETFRNGFEPMGGLCARIMADNFAILYPRSHMDSEKIMEIRRAAAQVRGLTQPIAFSIGRYIVNDRSLSVSAMYDRASLAEASVKARFDVQVAEYSESMRDDLLHEQRIINEMNHALESGQFEVWLQPQYNHSSGALIGAEALVRWIHPDQGIMAADDFIPIFERNGFIYDMDKYVWEQTAILLRKWLDEGRPLLPVSVNVSRYDVFRDDFYDTITWLVEKYAIPVDLFRLEITESAFAKSAQQIMDMVKRLIDYGFIIEIDDFGSGYSSLNTLKDIPANVLKLDMRFLENNENSMRGGNILQSIVRMAKWLGMLVIAEGVETKVQADYLRSIGCVYIQGYFYAKPMPVHEYEELAAHSNKEQETTVLETVETLDNDAFWDPQSMETLIFNSYVGGACIFEYNDGNIEILRINEKYAQELGGGHLSMEEALAIDIVEYMDQSNAATINGCVKDAINTDTESACEVRMRGLPGNSGYTYLRITIRVIARAGAHMLFYCSIINMTAQREAEQNERTLSDQMQIIMNNVNGGVSAVTIDANNTVRFAFANDRYYSMLGYTREQFHAELPNAFNVLHPDDIERIQEKVAGVLRNRQSDFYEYRCIKRDGGIIYVRCNASITEIEGVGNTVLLSVITDITAQRNAEQKEKETSDQLQAILQNIQGGISAATLVDATVDYIFVNDGYYSMFGYTREQFESELPRGIVDLIHPDDLPMVLDTASQAQESNQPFQIEYRAYNRAGELMWVQSNGSICHMQHYDLPIQLAVNNDITKEKKAELQILQSSEQLRFLNETARDLLIQEDANLGINNVLKKILDYFDGDRSYVVEMRHESETADNTYEVCAPAASCQIDNLQGIAFDLIGFWYTALE
ncbi:MAG: EAL domain-containing protein, partial [Syntrophomonadaceae bacterium]|nr:EAL domain-containing protein [Syntrophomonadaceae bacterium]